VRILPEPGEHAEFVIALVIDTAVGIDTDPGQNAYSSLIRIIADFLRWLDAAMAVAQKAVNDNPCETGFGRKVDAVFVILNKDITVFQVLIGGPILASPCPEGSPIHAVVPGPEKFVLQLFHKALLILSNETVPSSLTTFLIFCFKTMKMDSPNIVVIMSDQHSRKVLGTYGNRVVKTPHLDALAERGTVYENAYTNYPLCMPARWSFLTGKSPNRLGLWSIAAAMNPEIPTFAHSLNMARYETVLCGRMHFLRNQRLHGFSKRIFGENSQYAAGELEGTSGFDRKGIAKSGPGDNHYLLYDKECTERAVEWISYRSTQAENTPFCLVVGTVGPHCPFVCPKYLYDYYKDKVEIPATFARDTWEASHPFSTRFRERSRIQDVTSDEVRRVIASYYGMVEYDDSLVGRIVDAIDRSGLRSNTVIIYTSDHGELAGEHGLFWKYSFYEASVGIPLIVSIPGMQDGRKISSPVNLSDVAPTITKFAKASELPDIDSEVLPGVFDGLDENPERSVFSELLPDPQWSYGPSGGPARMLRKGEWKCNYYHNERAELFNMACDPDEIFDRADDPECGEILDAMLDEILDGWNPEHVIRCSDINMRNRKITDRFGGHTLNLDINRWRGPKGYGKLHKE
jgi:choline-sulfatase